MINREKFKDIKKKYVKIIEHYYQRNDYENVLKVAKYYCLYQHKLNQELTDLNLEELLSAISAKLFKTENIVGRDDLILLYDSIAVDNMALSMQYLLYLVDSGKKFIYIFKNSNRNNKLLNIVKKSPNCIHILSMEDNNYVDMSRIIRECIIEYSPGKVILHMGNSDIAGFVAFSNLHGCQKFFVNHGDEQFWIGRSILDYCIEFRALGRDISFRLRKIDSDKIILQPYYPIIEKGNFKGLEISESNLNRVKIFSGGRFVKTYGRNKEFLEMIRQVLHDNPDSCFIYAGSGNSKPMREFIHRFGLEDRWIIISYRNDLYELISRMDLYLGTFPLLGGLMSQTAAMAGIPIVELNPQTGNCSEDVLPLLEKYKVTCDTLQEYYARVKYLINNEAERRRIGAILKNALITKEEFDNNLNRILGDVKSNYKFRELRFDQEKAAKDYLDSENSLHEVPKLLRNRYIIRFYPFIGLSNLIRSKYYDFFNTN